MIPPTTDPPGRARLLPSRGTASRTRLGGILALPLGGSCLGNDHRTIRTRLGGSLALPFGGCCLGNDGRTVRTRLGGSLALPVGASCLGNDCRTARTRLGGSLALPCPHPFNLGRRGLGLIELLTIVAVLTIGLAFMVSMARHVRSTSANELTRKRMQAIARAVHEADGRGVDVTTRFPPDTARSDRRVGDREGVLQALAQLSSRNLASQLAGEPAAAGSAADLLARADIAARGIPELNDAWGRPIALLPGQVADVGMAPDDGPFLVSAGPDGRFLTLADNLYSYDLPVLLPALPQPATRPVLP
jgi:hypothetical protein